MSRPDTHHASVQATPWPGAWGTQVESARRFGRHWHNSFGVGRVESGAHHSSSGRGPVSAFAGDLITVNPGEVHDGRPLGGESRRWRMVYLEPNLVAGVLPKPTPGFAITRPVIQGDTPLRRALSELFEGVDAWRAGHVEALACDETLVRFWSMLAERYTTPAHDGTVQARTDLRVVRERLGDDLRDVPSLGELAVLVGMSRFQLLRGFERQYGMPPHAWLVARRAERARAEILAGRPLGLAAAIAGFADQSHMTRVFTRLFGVTPGALSRTRAKQPCNNVQDPGPRGMNTAPHDDAVRPRLRRR